MAMCEWLVNVHVACKAADYDAFELAMPGTATTRWNMSILLIYLYLRRLRSPWMHDQIERDEVRDHQQRHVDDRDRVRGAQLPCQLRQTDLVAMIVVDDEVDRSHEIEGDDEQPKERTYPRSEKREHGEQAGCEVAIRGERREAARQIGAGGAAFLGADRREPVPVSGMRRLAPAAHG